MHPGLGQLLCEDTARGPSRARWPWAVHDGTAEVHGRDLRTGCVNAHIQGDFLIAVGGGPTREAPACLHTAALAVVVSAACPADTHARSAQRSAPRSLCSRSCPDRPVPCPCWAGQEREQREVWMLTMGRVPSDLHSSPSAGRGSVRCGCQGRVSCPCVRYGCRPRVSGAGVSQVPRSAPARAALLARGLGCANCCTNCCGKWHTPGIPRRLVVAGQAPWSGHST